MYEQESGRGCFYFLSVHLYTTGSFHSGMPYEIVPICRQSDVQCDRRLIVGDGQSVLISETDATNTIV